MLAKINDGLTNSERFKLRRLKGSDRTLYDVYGRWHYQYGKDFLEFARRYEKCVCCGKSPAQFDHIVAQPYRKTSNGVKQQPMGSVAYLIICLNRGNLQFLCASCNCSKRQGWICSIHNKYLGIWNHLPNLDDVER